MDSLDTEEVEGDPKSQEHEVIGLLLHQEGEEGEEEVTVNLDNSGMVIMPSSSSTAQDEDDITIVTEGHTLSSLPAEPLAEGSLGGSPGAGIDGDAMRVDTEEGESSVASEEDSPQVKLEVVSDENLESVGSNLGTIPVSSIGGVQSIQNIGLGLQSNQAISVGALQAYTLPDGTTAFLQQPLGLKGEGKSLEGQTVQLPDGITAIVQSMASSEKGDEKSQLVDVVESPFIQASGKGLDGIHAVQLEDGTMAYLTSAPLFDEHGHLDPQAVALEQLSQQTQQELETDQTSSASVMPGTSSSGQKRSGGVLGLGGPRTAIKGSVQNLLAAAQATPEDRIAMASRMEKLNQLNSKAYKCTYEGCERLYTTQHHLRVHQRSHTGDRPFKCEFAECGKAFATGYGLKSHIRVHTGEKPYKCPENNCGKAFKTSGDLQKHIRIHTGERPFKCPFAGCFRSFTTSNIRKVHIRTHTGERPYICEEEGCRKAFASATNYKNHIRIHTGEKPYVCTVQGCGKRFTEYSSLYKHHVVHTHSKPYACSHCGKTYRQTSTLAMHRRTAHGEDITTDADGTLVFGTQEVTLSAVSKEEGGEGSMKTMPVRVQLMQASIAQGDPGKELVIAGEEPTGVTVSNPEGAASEAGSLVLQSSGSEQQQQQIVTVAQPQLLQHLQAQTITLTGDINNANGQQIYVVTDPAQLEALQQLAAQQQQQQQQQINIETGNGDENNQVNTQEESDMDSSIQEDAAEVAEQHQIITLVNPSDDTDASVMSEEDKLAAVAAAAKNGKVVYVSK